MKQTRLFALCLALTLACTACSSGEKDPVGSSAATITDSVTTADSPALRQNSDNTEQPSDSKVAGNASSDTSQEGLKEPAMSFDCTATMTVGDLTGEDIQNYVQEFFHALMKGDASCLDYTISSADDTGFDSTYLNEELNDILKDPDAASRLAYCLSDASIQVGGIDDTIMESLNNGSASIPYTATLRAWDGSFHYACIATYVKNGQEVPMELTKTADGIKELMDAAKDLVPMYTYTGTIELYKKKDGSVGLESIPLLSNLSVSTMTNADDLCGLSNELVADGTLEPLNVSDAEPKIQAFIDLIEEYNTHTYDFRKLYEMGLSICEGNDWALNNLTSLKDYVDWYDGLTAEEKMEYAKVLNGWGDIEYQCFIPMYVFSGIKSPDPDRVVFLKKDQSAYTGTDFNYYCYSSNSDNLGTYVYEVCDLVLSLYSYVNSLDYDMTH
ncbi:MAG: hypothetical protein E7256_09475 [Lachnospiraceae bacterium]|nr:hypothetical protein [Lachnospiraceae bacterium]